MFFKNNPKIFCVGRNKTGTTSLAKALSDLGYRVADQAKSEMLIKDYANAHWKPIIDFCKTADAFQDVPFSSPNTWLILHHYFPNSKFILTTRNAEDWYQSIVSFHAKLFSKDAVSAPNAQELKEANYRYKGFMWDENRAVWNTPENDLYNKELLINQYQIHNDSIRNFFHNKPNFIEIDVSKDSDYSALCKFLNKTPLYDKFPHSNKTSEINK